MTSNQAKSINLKVTGLKKAYDGSPVLNGIHFEVDAHSIFVIMGPSGSGKSVLLRHLIGLELPDEGEVLLNNGSINDPVVREELELAIVFQSGGLLNSISVGENVGLYLKEYKRMPAHEIEIIVDDSLRKVGLSIEHDKYKMPSTLSGGMKKRVAIARALAINPQMIFYDEPTSELDPLSAVTVGKQILHLNQEFGTTSIIVTHDRDLAFGIGHKIAIMQEGKLSKPETPNELLEKADEDIQRFLNAGKFEDYQSEATHLTV